MKVWIDLSNSPHPLIFDPIVRRLRAQGHEVMLTARDNAQTVPLAEARWPDEVEVIGGESPGGKRAKAAAIIRRVAELRRWASVQRPDVALSHNSYAQLLAASTRRIPAVTAMDFEHQPVNHLAFRLARTVLVPEVLPLGALRRQGASDRKLIRYPGLKEQLYIGDFEPNPDVLEEVGLRSRPKTLVVARTPPSRAVYHAFGNPLFEQALRTICLDRDAVLVALPRHPEQVDAIRGLGLSNCIVARSAVDSRSLMHAADAMIGAGGTMTREAALMGVPTWTLFAGKPPAADLWLEEQGMLRRLRDARELDGVGPRPSAPYPPEVLRRRAEAIESTFIQATITAASGS